MIARTLVALGLVVAAPGTLAAQADALADSSLQIAVRLASEGRSDSARALVRARLRALSPADSLYPGALYVAGVVADDADTAATYFRRVSIEYSRSAWADSALLRLAQLAFAAGDHAGALRSARRVLLDYPLSPARGEAAYWAGRTQFELDSIGPGCALLTQALELAGEQVELANRIRFHRQRCAVVAQAPDTAPRDAPRAGSTVYAVQVAAVRSVGAADELMRRLSALGHRPHVVRDADGLFKVRVGRFTRREEARQLAARLQRQVGGSPFVVEES